MQISHLKTYNWVSALRGMRNPLESWAKSDTVVTWDPEFGETPLIGPNDTALMKKLVRAGSDHRKFMRQIMISCDIKAPMYWWNQYSTYKVATSENSTSTMHTLGRRDLVASDFAWDYMGQLEQETLNNLNQLVNTWKQSTDPVRKSRIWRKLIQSMPTSFLYTRTCTMNYEHILAMYAARKSHKLEEWRLFLKHMSLNLPYIGIGSNVTNDPNDL